MSSERSLHVPALRIRSLNDRPLRADGAFVVYWMIAARRGRSNFALQRAVEIAKELGKPLVVLEALRAGHRWASDRLHRFALDGMRDNATWFSERRILYWPYVEPTIDAGKGLIAELSKHACAIVTDDFPCFMLPHMVDAAAAQSRVKLEAIDGNGILPLAATADAFPTAYAFRRFLQKNLREHLVHFPAADALAKVELAPLAELPREIAERWPRASAALLDGDAHELAALPIDHRVPRVAMRGGPKAAERELANFLETRLVDYADQRNELEPRCTSGLSPYLHWGHLSVHDVFRAIAKREGFELAQLSATAHGKKAGWWGFAPQIEAFLDQAITWRELGYVFCRHRPDYDRYESLPEWARRSLDEHANDRREHVYSLAELEAGATHDPLWNAAQSELVRDGRMHNYLRMLWGKKVLEWTRSPREALEFLIELNNRWALDGRNPNSYSGIAWCLGRFDRPWAPARPIFGVIRYMSSGNTARKLDVEPYLEKFVPGRARPVPGRLV